MVELTSKEWDEINLGYRTDFCLDFYDDAKETWFRLRYLDRE